MNKAAEQRMAEEKHEVGKETRAINAIVDHLLPLNEEQRSRVLAYAVDLFGFEAWSADENEYE